MDKLIKTEINMVPIETYNMPLNAQYTHNKNPLPGFNVGFSYNGISVDVDLAGLKDEMTTTTEVYYDR